MTSYPVENKKWVSNEVANQVVAEAQLAVAQKQTKSVSISKLMDLVAGVSNYKVYDHRHQGLIKRIYNLERKSKYSHGPNTLSSNFAIDFDDVISAFWEAVFKRLPSAATTGNMVNVRIVEGQKAKESTLTPSGLVISARPTKCNPINFLKQHGVLGVRNMLNKSYRKHITQICEDCGHTSNVASRELHGAECPKCKSPDTEKIWPSGNSTYRSKKSRRCNACKARWSRTFVRSCLGCNSENVHTDTLVINNEDSMLHHPSSEKSVEDTIMTYQAEQEVSTLLDEIYKSLPRDPRYPNKPTHTHSVFELLTRPAASKEMCGACVKAAPIVCAEKCKQATCNHDKLPDPTISCGSSSMATSVKCVNYSKKIAEYHDVSASLASRRVKKVRKYVAQYISTNRGLESLDTMYRLLNQRGLL